MLDWTGPEGGVQGKEGRRSWRRSPGLPCGLWGFQPGWGGLVLWGEEPGKHSRAAGLLPQPQAPKEKRHPWAARAPFLLSCGVSSVPRDVINRSASFAHMQTILETVVNIRTRLTQSWGRFGSSLCWTLPIPEISRKTFPRLWVMQTTFLHLPETKMRLREQASSR